MACPLLEDAIKAGNAKMCKPITGVTYILRSSIYISLTNRCNAISLIESRGPSFAMPVSSGFNLLPANIEPTAQDVAAAVNAALDDERLLGASTREVCFAGAGEPLMKRRVLEEAAQLISQQQGDALKIRLNTNGLVPDSEVADVASSLKAAGFSGASVALCTADPAQYAELMKPDAIRLTPAFTLPLGHEQVTGFIAACVAAGMSVECNAVARPEVDIEAAGALATSLGASFRERSWHP